MGDYTLRLADALRGLGIEADIFSDDTWSLLDVGRAYRRLGDLAPDIVHIQYPASGFGHRLGPQLYAMLERCITTVHEASQSHVLRKLSLYPFTMRAQHLIFTSEYERQFAASWAPWIDTKSSVIPIGSNVDRYVSDASRLRRREIVYFGLLMPRKGLEDVVGLAGLIKEQELDLVVRVIGSHRPEHLSYVGELRRKSAGLPVLWEEGLADGQVSERLAGALVAYLPYPDGASERRTTLKAALLNRMAVVTTRGPATPEDMERVVRFAASQAQALAIILNLFSNELERSELEVQVSRYVQRFDWTHIARAHSRLYERVLENHADCH